MEIVWNALQKRISVCAQHPYWSGEVCDLLLPTWYDVMTDTRITWEKNDNFYSRLTGVPSGDPGSGDSILRNTCRILPDGDNLCETTDHLLFPFSLLGGLVTNSFVWCLVWLMHWHVAACWVTRPTAIHSNPKRWWLLMASLWLRRLYRLHLRGDLTTVVRLTQCSGVDLLARMTVYDCASVGAGACLDASIAGVLGRLFAHGSISLLYMLTLLALNLWFLSGAFTTSPFQLCGILVHLVVAFWMLKEVVYGFPHFLVLICSPQRATLGCNTRENGAPMSHRLKSKLSDGESRHPEPHL